MTDWLKMGADILHGPFKMPKAYLGLSKAFDKPTVRICARCEDREAAEALATAQGHDMTHTHCDECQDQLMRDLARLKEKEGLQP